MITQVLYSYVADLMKERFIPTLTLIISDKVLGGKWWNTSMILLLPISRVGLP